MTRKLFTIAGVAFGGVFLAVACSAPPPPAPAEPAKPAADLSPAHGQYLVETHVCHDCHTPAKNGPNGPEPDMSRMLSGHPADLKITTAPSLPANGPWLFAGIGTFTAWAGPWGISFTANLTPDKNTGLGIWTEDMFIKALRTGKHMGTASSRDILPPMPWQWFSKMTDDELKAIWAYLRTIPPVDNRVPDPIPPAGAPKGVKGNN